MEAIAKEAGVGVGTLYRHFPKRIDVVEAVYRDDVDELVCTAEQAVADLEPWPAVVALLEAFVRYAQGKRTFLNELHEAFEKNPELRLNAGAHQPGDGPGHRPGPGGRGRPDRHRRGRPDAAGGPDVHELDPVGGPEHRLLAMILDGLRLPE